VLALCALVAAATLAATTGCTQQAAVQKAPVHKASAHKASAKTAVRKKAAADKLYPVTIRAAGAAPRVDTGVLDAHGNQVTVACSTCHATRPANTENRSAKDLDEFHAGMQFSHGGLTCLSCHNQADYDTLKLADGKPVAFQNVMQLCGQCHGPQMKDYQHGAHGGMNGHWDLTRGPRTRNNCIDCHHPHAPQFPHMRPTFKPKDRFLDALNDHPELHHDANLSK